MTTATADTPAMWGSRRLAPCGSDGAFQRHQRKGEDPCQACWEAHRLANAQRRAKRAGTPIPQVAPPMRVAKCGSRTGYQRHKRRGEDVCKPCEEAARKWGAAYNKARSSGARRGRPSYSAMVERLATPQLLARIDMQPDAELLREALGLPVAIPAAADAHPEGA